MSSLNISITLTLPRVEFCSHGAQVSAVLFTLWHLNRDGSAPETGHSPHWGVCDAPSWDFSTAVFTPTCLPGPHPLCSGLTFLLVPRLASLLKPPFVWVADFIQVWKRQKAFYYKQHKMILDFLDLKHLVFTSPALTLLSLRLQIPISIAHAVLSHPHTSLIPFQFRVC